MTLSEMFTAVRNRLGNPPNDEFFTDDILTDIVNEALQVVSTEADWPWLQATDTITTELETAAYDVPEGWVKTKQLFISGYDPLIEISLAELDSIVWQGQPAYYAIFLEQIVLGPIPGSIYDVTHQYYIQEPALTDDDSPIMPAMFHYAIVTAAAAICQRRQMRMDWAEMEDKQYEKWLKRMNNYRYRDQKPIRPRIRPGSQL